MKNLFKKSALKAVLVCLFMVISFSAVFAISTKHWNLNKGNVSIEQPDHDHDHETYTGTITFNYLTGDVSVDDESNASTSAVQMNTGIRLLLWNNSTYESLSTSNSIIFNGGTKIKIESSSESDSNEIPWSGYVPNSTTEKEKNVLHIEDGNTTYYLLVISSYGCHDCYVATSIISEGTTEGQDLTTWRTFETLDPNYTGTINLTATMVTCFKQISGYVIEENGKNYTVKEENFPMNGSFDATGAKPEDYPCGVGAPHIVEPSGGDAKWHVNTKHGSYNTTNFSLAEKSDEGRRPGFTYNDSIALSDEVESITLNDTINPHASNFQSNLNNTATNPLIVGVKSLSHTITVLNTGRSEDDSYDEYWKGLNSDVDDGQYGVQDIDGNLSDEISFSTGKYGTRKIKLVESGKAFQKTNSGGNTGIYCYGIWNYGFDFSHYVLKVEYIDENDNSKTITEYFKSDFKLTSNDEEKEFKVPVDDNGESQLTFSTIATHLDNLAGGLGRMPKLTLIPYWTPANIVCNYDADNNTNTPNSVNHDNNEKIVFGSSYEDLKNPYSDNTSYDYLSFFTYKVESNENAGTSSTENNEGNYTNIKNLLARAGVWNYKDIDGGLYVHVEGNDYYTLNVEPVTLDGVKIVKLSGFDESTVLEGITDDDLEDWKVESVSDGTKQTENLTKYEIQETTSELNDQSWIDYWISKGIPQFSQGYIDDYVTSKLQVFIAQYNEANNGNILIGNDGDINLNTVYKKADNTLHIYLPVNSTNFTLPMFKAKERVIAAWSDDASVPNIYASPAYCDNRDFAVNCDNSDFVVNKENKKGFQSTGTLTAVYMNKLNMFYETGLTNDYDPDIETLTIKPALYYNANTVLDLNKLYDGNVTQDNQNFEYYNDKGAIIGHNLKLGDYKFTFGGWLFDADVATNKYNYVVKYSEEVLTVETPEGTEPKRKTTFTATKIGSENKKYYITSVQGDPFVQDEENPIITIKWNKTYEFTFDNSKESADIYWEGFDSTKDNDSLFGAFEGSNGGFKAVVPVSNHQPWYGAYRFFESITDSDLHEYAFYHGEDMNTVAYENQGGNVKYAVYNYGHHIIKYTISFTYKVGETYETKQVSVSGGKFIVNNTQTKIPIGSLNNENTTLDMLAKFIDDYFIENNIKYQKATATIIPTWEAVYVQDGRTLKADDVQDGGEKTTTSYGLENIKFGSTPYALTSGLEWDESSNTWAKKDAKTHFAYSYTKDYHADQNEDTNNLRGNETNLQLISIKGVWNYQDIHHEHYEWDGSTYRIALYPVFLDNLVCTVLTGVNEIGDGEDADFNVVDATGRNFINTTSNPDILTYANYGNYSNLLLNDYKYRGNYGEGDNNQTLIDDYMAQLKEDMTKYNNEILNNANSDVYHIIMGEEIKPNATNADGTKKGNNYLIYLANNRTPVIPIFKDHLAKSVYWKDADDSSKYTHLAHNAIAYEKELTGQLEEKDVWTANSVGNSREGNKLTPIWVYSLELFYDTPEGKENYQNVNTQNLEEKPTDKKPGYFAPNTDLNLLNNSTQYNDVINLSIVPKDLKAGKYNNDSSFKFYQLYDENPYRIFDGWALNTTKLDNTYSVSEATDAASSKKFVSIKKGSNKWEFYFDQKNKYDEKIYYITGIKSANARFAQNTSDPIVYATWRNVYVFTIDNSQPGYWETFNSIKEKNTDLYNAGGSTDGGYGKTILNVANIDYFNGLAFAHSEGLGFDQISSKSGTDVGYNLINYGFYVSAYKIAISNGGDTYYFTYSLTEGWTSNTTNSGTTALIDALNESDGSSRTQMKDLCHDIDELLTQFPTDSNAVTMTPIWQPVNIKAVYSNGNELCTFNFKSDYSLDETATDAGEQLKQGKSLMAFHYGAKENGSTNLIAKSATWNYQNITPNMYSYNAKSNQLGAGTYTIVLKGVYVDNIYKISLTDIRDYESAGEGSASYEYRLIEDRTNYRFNEYSNFSYNGSGHGYSNSDTNADVMFTYYDTIHSNAEGLFKYNYTDFNLEFKAEENQPDDCELVDYYINGEYHEGQNLGYWLKTYREAISTGVGSDKQIFSCFKKVFYDDNGADRKSDVKIHSAKPAIKSGEEDDSTNKLLEMSIFLANGQKYGEGEVNGNYGDLPIFDNLYLAPIFYINENTQKQHPGSDKYHYAYKTSIFDNNDTDQLAEIVTIKKRADGDYGNVDLNKVNYNWSSKYHLHPYAESEADFDVDFTELNRWYYADGPDANAIKFQADYYRKSYFVTADVVMDRGDLGLTGERRGFAIIEIDDTWEYNQKHQEWENGGKIGAEPVPESFVTRYLFIYEYKSVDDVKYVKSAIYKYNHNMASIEDEGFKFSEDFDDETKFTPINTKFIQYEQGGPIEDTEVTALRVFAGCNIAMHVYDQSQDPTAMKTGHYDDMIGYKYTGKIEQTYTPFHVDLVDENIKVKTMFESVADDYKFGNSANDYTYSVDAKYLANDDGGEKPYGNRSLVALSLVFEKIEYTVVLDIDLEGVTPEDNVNADFYSGKLILTTDYVDDLDPANSKELKSFETIDDFTVETIYNIYYHAYVGFKLRSNAFVLNNDGFNGDKYSLLQRYEEYANNTQSELNEQQLYEIQNDNNSSGSVFKRNDKSLDGTWLRLFFYERFSDINRYNINKIILGTLAVQTTPIDFEFAIKVHNNETSDDKYSESNVVSVDQIPGNETVRFSYFKGDLYQYNGALMKLPDVENLFTGKDDLNYGFYYYETNSTKYVPINSRLYFPSNPDDAEGTFMQGYEFKLMTKEGILYGNRDLKGTDVAKTLVGYTDGEGIIPISARKFYMVLEVKRLLEFDVQIVKQTGDNGASTRSITVSSDKSNVNVEVLGGTECAVGESYTPQKVYTYFGLSNRLSATYNIKNYSTVEYNFNDTGIILPDPNSGITAFTLNNGNIDTLGNVLIVKFIPKAPEVIKKYSLDGTLLSNPDIILNYVQDESVEVILNEDGTASAIKYVVKSKKPEYYILVDVNGSDITSSLNGNPLTLTHNLSIDDLSGDIIINININPLPVGAINVYINTEDGSNIANAGSLKVHQLLDGGELEEMTSVGFGVYTITEGAEVYVELNLNAGYYYTGNYTAGVESKTGALSDGKLKIINQYKHNNIAKTYIIIVNRTIIKVDLDLSGVVNGEYSINNKKYSATSEPLVATKVNERIHFNGTQEISKGQRFIQYYYTAKNSDKITVSNQIRLIDFKIDQNLLNNIFGDDYSYSSEPETIEFVVETINTYKAVFNIAGKGFLGDFKASINGNDVSLTPQHPTGDIVRYTTGYYDEGSELTFSASTTEPGKYHIVVNDIDKYTVLKALQGNNGQFDAIVNGDISIELLNNLDAEISIIPYEYSSTSKEFVYQTLKQLIDKTPAEIDSDSTNNNLSSSELKYGSAGSLTFVRSNEDVELKAIYLSGNGMEDKLCIMFSKTSFNLYKIGEDNQLVSVSARDYGLNIEYLESAHIKLSFIVEDNIHIEFEYVVYKTITF